ncbi:hypothetical protein MHYP_G00289520 [Metynnis hypsauchen]
MSELLASYSTQFCIGQAPQMRIYEMVVYKQEGMSKTHAFRRVLCQEIQSVLQKISTFTIFTLQNIPNKGENAPNVLLDREKKLQNLDFEDRVKLRPLLFLHFNSFNMLLREEDQTWSVMESCSSAPCVLILLTIIHYCVVLGVVSIVQECIPTIPSCAEELGKMQ